MKKSGLYYGTLLLCILSFSQQALSQTLTLTPSNYNGFNISCAGFADGSINMTITGGTPPYTIRWSNDRTSEDIIGLQAGYYSVEVDDSDPFTDFVYADITLIEPEPLNIIELTPYEYQNGYNVSQYGACNGSVTANVTGGVPPYAYIWQPGNQTIYNPTNLCGNENQISVTDNNGCIVASGIGLREPERDDWTMSGNYNSNPANQFIGTLDSKDLSFRTNNVERLRIKADGSILMNTLVGTGSKIVFADSLGVMRSIPFQLPICAGTVATPWQQSPNHWEDAFSCYRRFGIGTDSPREKLEVKGTFLVSAWDNTMSNMADYIQVKHDGVNARIENFGTGDLLLNYGNPRNVKVNLGSGSGYFETGSNTYLATGGGKVGINTINPVDDLQIGNLFTFSSANSKFIGYNHDFNAPYNHRIDASKSTSVICFNENGNFEIKLANADPGNSLITNWTDALIIDGDGRIGIGTHPVSNFQLAVCGSIKAGEVEVRAIGTWCDFVFEKNYQKRSILELEAFLQKNKHLPYIKSGQEIEQNGINVAETMHGIVQNLEETRLEIIELYKMISALQTENNNLLQKLDNLQSTTK